MLLWFLFQLLKIQIKLNSFTCFGYFFELLILYHRLWETPKDQVWILVWMWQSYEHQTQILGFLTASEKDLDIPLRFHLLSAFSAILLPTSMLSCNDMYIYKHNNNTVFRWNLGVNLPLNFYIKLAYISEFSHLFKSMLLKSDSIEVSRNHIGQQRIVQVFQNYSHFKAH